MDIQGQLKCQKHCNNDILFVKVKNIKDEEDVFYCELCPFSESNFSMSDCTPIKSILNWNEESPIINLFPFNDQELIKKLKDIFQKNIYEQLPNQINQFYDDLQANIMQMIVESKKTSITLAQQLCEQKQKVLQQYKQAVNVDEIKKILQSQNSNSDQIQKIYKDYMKTIFQNSERNTQIINDLNKEQQIICSELKLVQKKIISSCLIQIKMDNDFFKNFPLIVPNQIDLMPQLNFRKVDKQTNITSQSDILKMVNNQIQFKMFDQNTNSLTNYFYESNIVLNQCKLYIFRFQVSNVYSQKIQVLLSNNSKVYNQGGGSQFQQMQPNNQVGVGLFQQTQPNNQAGVGLYQKIQPNNQLGVGLFQQPNNQAGIGLLQYIQPNNQGGRANQESSLNNQGGGGLQVIQQNNQTNFLISIQNNGNNQIQFGQNQHFQPIKGDLNQNFNCETIFEIKMLISKGIFEVSDYPNKQIILALNQNYQSQLQASLKEQLSLSFSGSLVLIHAIEFEQQI